MPQLKRPFFYCGFAEGPFTEPASGKKFKKIIDDERALIRNFIVEQIGAGP